MTPRIIGVLTFVVVAVGVAVGVYFASQVSDGTTAAQEGGENTAATAEALIQQSLAEGTVPPALTITPYPTCPPEPPTPTPIPGEQSTYWLVTPAPWPCIPADQPPPDKTPDLSSLFQRPREPEECETCIDLSKPIPYEVPMGVAGKTIHLPVGSTHKLHISECPPVGVPGSRPCGPNELLHVIERGGSKVVIDAHTGAIIEWSVAPEDEADFRSLILEPLDASPPTLEDQLARLEEECLEKGILPPTITPDDIPATPPWLVTPTVHDPVKQLRDALNRASPSQKLIITEDIVVSKGFGVFPEDLDPERFDPAKFSQDNVGYSIDHIPSLSSISLDRQGRETTRHAGTGGTLSGTQGIAELERVLADPAVFAMVLDFLNQPLDPCEVYSGLRNSLPEVCLTTKE